MGCLVDQIGNAGGACDSGARWRVLITQKFSSLAGAQISLASLLEAIDRKEFSPHVLVSNTGWLTERCEALEIPWEVMPFGHSSGLASVIANARLERRLREYIREHRIDLVHANEHWVGPQSYRAARAEGIPVICQFRTGLEDLTPRRIRKYRYGSFDQVIVVAGVLKEAIDPYVEEKERIVVVRDGVELSGGESRSWRERGTRVVVTVGAIYEVKGQAKIFEKATPWLKASRRNFLIFVGGTRADLGYLAELRQRVSEEKLDKQVLFLGIREDVPRLLRAADVLAAYSTVEGIPRVVMEAMLASRPVIVSNTPGMSEIVTDGVTGRIVNFDDSENAFCEALEDMGRDYAAWEVMGARARARVVEECSTEAMCEGVLNSYRKVLGERSNG